MERGKTIELFLVNGTAEGLVTAELSNWNGKAVRIPRTEVPSYSEDDIINPGIYFLFCEDDDGNASVYIGEAENVLERLSQHIRDFSAGKEPFYWHTAVAFVGGDLNKAFIRYLENRLVEIAKEAGNYKVLTKNTFKNTVLKQSQKASMEVFLENIEVLISALGYKVLTPPPKATDDTTYFYCDSTNGANAKGFISAGGFTVVHGSKISEHVTGSLLTYGKCYYDLRNKLIADGIIADNTFVKDYEFSAPSAASTVVLGRKSNGTTDWKTDEKVKLKDV